MRALFKSLMRPAAGKSIAAWLKQLGEFDAERSYMRPAAGNSIAAWLKQLGEFDAERSYIV